MARAVKASDMVAEAAAWGGEERGLDHYGSCGVMVDAREANPWYSFMRVNYVCR